MGSVKDGNGRGVVGHNVRYRMQRSECAICLGFVV